MSENCSLILTIQTMSEQNLHQSSYGIRNKIKTNMNNIARHFRNVHEVSLPRSNLECRNSRRWIYFYEKQVTVFSSMVHRLLFRGTSSEMKTLILISTNSSISYFIFLLHLYIQSSPVT